MDFLTEGHPKEGPERSDEDQELLTFDDFLDGCVKAERQRLAEIDSNLPFTDDE